MEQGVQSVFPTPIAYYHNTEIVDDLKSYIMSLETKGIESKVAVKIKHNLIESDFNLLYFCSVISKSEDQLSPFMHNELTG